MSSDGQVIDNPARGRFELVLPGGATAFIDYYHRDGMDAGVDVADGVPRPDAAAGAAAAGGAAGAPTAVCVLTHAEVPMELRGAGVGARLTAGTLELLRARGAKIVPLCPYVVQFIRRHPQYADLVAR